MCITEQENYRNMLKTILSILLSTEMGFKGFLDVSANIVDV